MTILSQTLRKLLVCYEMREKSLSLFLVAFLFSSKDFGFFFSAVEGFKQTDEEYLTEERGQPKNAGSTASTALLIGDKLIVANVGDSRVVASRNGSGSLLSFSLQTLKLIDLHSL